MENEEQNIIRVCGNLRQGVVTELINKVADGVTPTREEVEYINALFTDGASCTQKWLDAQ